MKKLSFVTAIFVIFSFYSCKICLAKEISGIRLAEGMTIQDVEKSLGITKKRKKKNTSNTQKLKRNKNNKSTKSKTGKKVSSSNSNMVVTKNDTVDVDKLLQELDSSSSKNKSDSKSGKSSAESFSTDSSGIVESIGIGNLRSMPYAEAIIVNKITTKSQNVIFKISDVKFFGNISVEIHKCINDPNPLRPNDIMLMTIFDNKIDDDKLSIFHGWMMSNSLSASTLEHPVYEIIPVKCHARTTGDSADKDTSSDKSTTGAK